MRELEPDVWIDPGQVSIVNVVPREGWLEAVTSAISRYGASLECASVTRFTWALPLSS
jgi:hypothetical protein